MVVLTHASSAELCQLGCAMPRRSFKYLIGQFPNSHLIIGRVEAAVSIAVAEVVVARLIEILGSSGDWATQSTHDDLGYAVHCLFIEKNHADRLAAAMRAKTVMRAGDFASQREFSLGPEARKAISAALMGCHARKA